MAKSLVIVESPTKAKTISRFLGSNYHVESSFGHIRDLPKSKMGVDIEKKTFEPKYEIPKDKSKHVKKLKELAKKSNEIIFATDEDREGEAISWHLAYILKIKPEKAKRIVFHEITKHAITEALKKPRHIDDKLVDAQQARRVLDRLVGYELSPLLWKKVVRGLSAGRVQSVAVRMLTEREREIQAFKPQEYWSIEGIFNPKKKKVDLSAALNAINDKKVAKLDLKNKKQVDGILSDLKDANYKIENINNKQTKRNPYPPFITSSLQAGANSMLGYSSARTMRIAQQLYEGVEIGSGGAVGLITYMRTDSTNLSKKFLDETKEYIEKIYGDKYYPEKTRFFKKKAKGAQEAHEAIRPTHIDKEPDQIKKYLSTDQYKLYKLIYLRTLASQMAAAKLNKTAIDIISDTKTKYSFRANGQTIVFDGWLKLYPKKVKEETLPELEEDQKMDCHELKPDQHFTEPPSRYSDATLVKALEAHGIGRPSTYAPTIATIIKRKYAQRDDNKKLKPTEIAFTVNDLLVKHFPNIVDFEFTADMEDSLDKIAHGKRKWQPLIKEFYTPFHNNIEKKTMEISKKEVTEEKTDITCPDCGKPVIKKLGRYGKFLSCSNYPDCKYTQNLEEDGQASPEPEKTDEKCDKCGAPMVKRTGKYGPFLGCSKYPDCKNIKNTSDSKTGVKCTKCKKGEFAARRGRGGRVFYACDAYPECKNILWGKPTGELCKNCSEPMVFGPKDTIKCSNKDCS